MGNQYPDPSGASWSRTVLVVIALAVASVAIVTIAILLNMPDPAKSQMGVQHEVSHPAEMNATSTPETNSIPSNKGAVTAGNNDDEVVGDAGFYVIENVKVATGYKDVFLRPVILVSFDLTYHGPQFGEVNDINLKVYQGGTEIFEEILDNSNNVYANTFYRFGYILPGRKVHIKMGFDLENSDRTFRVTAQRGADDKTLMFDKTFKV